MNCRQRSGFRSLFAVCLFLLVPVSLFAGFPATEVFLPAVGRVQGAGNPPSQFYSTVWATNLTSSSETVTFEFLKQGQANTTPVGFTDMLSAGQTKVYENIVENSFHQSNALGAARVTATGEVFVSERIYNQLPGDDIGNTEGLFFAGVPKAFSISLGQTASIQGVNQGGAENFRYNFALIETGGGTPTVHVALLDDSGATLGAKDYVMQPYEQIQPNVAELDSAISTTNARIVATVTSGTGSVLMAGAQVANESQDPSGYEMSFRTDILGGNGSAGVTSLNSLTGALTLKAGSNVTITPSGNSLTIAATGGGAGSGVSSLNGLTGALAVTAGSGISVTPSGSSIQVAYTGGGGSGLTSVAHDSSLSGQGTGASPLAIADGQVVRSLNGLHDGLTLTAGDNVTITPSGSTLTITSKYLTLPFSQTSSSDRNLLDIANTGRGYAILARSSTETAILAQNAAPASTYLASMVALGVGEGVEGLANNIGVYGLSGGCDHCESFPGRTGVYGEGDSSVGVYGVSNSNMGVAGYTDNVGGGKFAIYAVGDVGATGNKSFVEPHPTDPTKEIRYVCLEGPESGTYFRGTGHIVNGFATIEVPEHFRMVTSEKGLTVGLTPVGEMAVLAVVRRGLDRIVVQGSRDVEFDYMVNGVRRSYPSWQPVVENRSFVPRSPDDPMIGKGLSEEGIRRLKANGILNEDGSINLDTAHRLGWDKQESWKQTEVIEK